jgi:hypothetical protein
VPGSWGALSVRGARNAGNLSTGGSTEPSPCPHRSENSLPRLPLLPVRLHRHAPTVRGVGQLCRQPPHHPSQCRIICHRRLYRAPGRSHQQLCFAGPSIPGGKPPVVRKAPSACLRRSGTTESAMSDTTACSANIANGKRVSPQRRNRGSDLPGRNSSSDLLLVEPSIAVLVGAPYAATGRVRNPALLPFLGCAPSLVALGYQQNSAPSRAS